MKTVESKVSAELVTLIEKAVEFHGHLGPFLVLGVRMGLTGLKKVEMQGDNGQLHVTVRLENSVPFTCILDGLQITTRCTIGNQKLELENSQGEITACFKLQNSWRILKIQVNPEIIEKLKDRYSEGASNEELAWEIASMSENQLFVIKNNKYFNI